MAPFLMAMALPRYGEEQARHRVLQIQRIEDVAAADGIGSKGTERTISSQAISTANAFCEISLHTDDCSGLLLPALIGDFPFLRLLDCRTATSIADSTTSIG